MNWILLAVVVVVAGGLLFRFRRPITKEKVAFLVFAALLMWSAFQGETRDDGALADAVDAEAAERADGDPSLIARVIGEEDGSDRIGSLGGDDPADPNRPAGAADRPGRVLTLLESTIRETVRPSGRASLFEQSERYSPVDLIDLPPPATPGVDVATTITPDRLAPRSLPNRQPLGRLEPLPGRASPPDESR